MTGEKTLWVGEGGVGGRGEGGGEGWPPLDISTRWEDSLQR